MKYAETRYIIPFRKKGEKELRYHVRVGPFFHADGRVSLTVKESDHGIDATAEVAFPDDIIKGIYINAVKTSAQKNGVEIRKIDCGKTLALAPLPLSVPKCTIELAAPVLPPIERTVSVNYDLWSDRAVRPSP